MRLWCARKKVASQDWKLTFVFSSSSGLWPHGCANKHPMLPAEGLINQRNTCKEFTNLKWHSWIYVGRFYSLYVYFVAPLVSTPLPAYPPACVLQRWLPQWGLLQEIPIMDQLWDIDWPGCRNENWDERMVLLRSMKVDVRNQIKTQNTKQTRDHWTTDFCPTMLRSMRPINEIPTIFSFPGRILPGSDGDSFR